jgi:serine/threonine protein kinase
MNIVLTVVAGPRAGVRARFTGKSAVTLGRSKTTDFHVLDGTMSRVHAVLSHDGADWWIEDQKSRNGTWVGERRLEGRERIAGGTVFFLGKETGVRFDVEADELRASSANFQVAPACAACGDTIRDVAALVRSPDGRPFHLRCRNLDHLIGTDLGEFRVAERAPALGDAFFFRAHQPTLNRSVLLAVFDPPLTSRHGFRQQLLEEVRRASRFVHPNLLQIYAYEEARGMCVVVIEHFAGERLSHVLEHRRFAKIRDAVTVATGITEALRYARTEGVVVPWIAPGSVLVSEATFETKVKLFEEPSADGVRVATAADAAYVAPEMLAGAAAPDAAASERAMVYSCAAILYHMLAGLPPFEGDTVQEVLRRAQRESPPALRRVNLKVSPALAKVVEEAISRDPAARPATLDEFLDRLRTAAAPIR